MPEIFARCKDFQATPVFSFWFRLFARARRFSRTEATWTARPSGPRRLGDFGFVAGLALGIDHSGDAIGPDQVGCVGQTAQVKLFENQGFPQKSAFPERLGAYWLI
jgi:hypothetical protein